MRKAGDIILDWFRDRYGSDFMENAESTAGLFSSWERVAAEVWPDTKESRADAVAGEIPAAAVHSRIRELERGVLLVEADHPGWVQILQTKQAQLLSVVQRRHPDLGIRGIAFRLSREPISAQAAHTGDDVVPQPEEGQSYQGEAGDSVPVHTGSRDLSGDEEFYRALKGLQKSIKERNSL